MILAGMRGWWRVAPILLFSNQEISEAFQLQDMSILRAEFLAVRIGPMPYRAPLQHTKAKEAHDARVRDGRCSR